MIQIGKCVCGNICVPLRKICPQCRKPMIKTRIPSESAVLSFTECHVPPEGFPNPVVLVLVEFNFGGKLLCTTKNQNLLEIGKNVRIYQEGDIFYCESITMIDKIRYKLEHPFTSLIFRVKSRLHRK